MRCRGSQRRGKTCGRVSDTPAEIDYQEKNSMSASIAAKNGNYMYMYYKQHAYTCTQSSKQTHLNLSL